MLLWVDAQESVLVTADGTRGWTSHMDSGQTWWLRRCEGQRKLCDSLISAASKIKRTSKEIVVSLISVLVTCWPTQRTKLIEIYYFILACILSVCFYLLLSHSFYFSSLFLSILSIHLSPYSSFFSSLKNVKTE